MKQALLLFLFVFSITHISFAQLSLSLVAKGSYGFGNIQQAFQTQNNFAEADPIFEMIPFNNNLRVRPAFEIGVEGGFPMNKRFNFIFGLNFQQVRLESISWNSINSPSQNTLSQIYYLKIPLLLEINLYKDKLFLHTGIYAASKIGYHQKKLKRKSSNPLVIEGDDQFTIINSSDQLNSFLFGFQTGIKYQFWKKLSVNMSYAHSFNNLLNEDTFLDIKLNNFSFGLQWRFM